MIRALGISSIGQYGAPRLVMLRRVEWLSGSMTTQGE